MAYKRQTKVNATIDFMDLLQEPAADEKQAAEN